LIFIIYNNNSEVVFLRVNETAINVVTVFGLGLSIGNKNIFLSNLNAQNNIDNITSVQTTNYLVFPGEYIVFTENKKSLPTDVEDFHGTCGKQIVGTEDIVPNRSTIVHEAVDPMDLDKEQENGIGHDVNETYGFTLSDSDSLPKKSNFETILHELLIKLTAIIIHSKANSTLHDTTNILHHIHQRAIESINEKIQELKTYIPHYELILPPKNNDGIVVMSIRVKGTGDYLPEYAGNLDIINCAAIKITEELK
jgi:hypothetical protein